MEQKNQLVRFLGMTLMVVLMGVGFAACSDDDDDNSDIVGTWNCTNKAEDTPYWVFNSDGKGYAMVFDGHKMPFSYKLKGTTLTVAWDDDWEDPDIWSVLINDDTLILYYGEYYDENNVDYADWIFERAGEETAELSTSEGNSFKSTKAVDLGLPSDIKCSQYHL